MTTQDPSLNDYISKMLSKLAASYKSPEPEPIAPKPPMKKLRDASLVATLPAPKVFIPVPQVGYYDASGFLLALRDAGKRLTKEGKPFHDPSQVRDDQIRAIAGFIGYDPCGDFGSQELRARMMAQRALAPVSPVNPSPRLAGTVHGYIAGMPNELRKRALDLQAREKMAAEAIGEHEKLAAEATDETDRQYHTTLAMIERERLDQIQADLDNLV